MYFIVHVGIELEQLECFCTNWHYLKTEIQLIFQI